MNEIKEKIREMINEETVAKRKEELSELRVKKSKNKSVKKEHIPMDVDKKKTLGNLSLAVLLFIISIGLFYAASITKESAENTYRQQLETKAKQELDTLAAKSSQRLNQKINNFNFILNDAEYIKNFNVPSWQDVLKTELAARLGDQAVVDVIPADYIDDVIIENPAMGYGILALLNDLKSKTSGNVIKIEYHQANKEQVRVIFVQKITSVDVEQQKERINGYILARLSQSFVQGLTKDFESHNGYFEIVQIYSGRTSVLASKGNASLKTGSVVISKKIAKTPWLLKFWPAEQPTETPFSLLWLAMLFLVVGTAAIVSALFVLFLMLKRIRESRYVGVQKITTSKEKTMAATHDSSDIAKSQAPTNIIFRKNSGISLEEENSTDAEYLTYVTDKIFRAYDIRGVVGELVNPEVFRQIAYAIAAEMAEQQQTKISIACDGRNSSPELVKALIDALLESGINVLDIGMVSSPVLYFSAITKTDGNGIIVTASHNPADYNGMKIMLKGHSYSDKHLQKLKNKVINGEQVTGNGELVEMNVMEEYMTKITGNIILARPMNIVIDTANGVTGKFATTFFEQLGCKVTALNTEVDGNFPAHEPDPSRPENMSELIEKVMEQKADVGIAFDGDGDRIGLVSSGGEIIWPDRILMLLAKDILSRNKDATILYDVKSSWNVERFVSGLGGSATMCQSGHSFMKSKLLETGALLAGEMSGHIFIKERWYGFDDALFVAARVLEILSIDLRKSRQVFAELPDSLNTPEILIATDNGPGIMEKINAGIDCFGEGKVITIDGVRVEYSDGWGLVRASNTTDNLTMRFEAENEEALQRIANIFKEAILRVAPQVEFPF